MRYPNAFKGVRKIFLAEVLMLLTAILGVVLLFMVDRNSMEVAGELVVNNSIKRTATILTIAAAVIALLAFLLNLAGVINARRDNENFRVALFVTILGILAGGVSAVWSSNERLVKWMDTATTLCSLFASYYVLTGIAELAQTYPDNATKALAEKSRNLLCATFAVPALIRIAVMLFRIQNETVLIILSVAALLLELVSYVVYMRALSRGKQMLSA